MIRCLAFDLDDTILDTSTLLIPQAARTMCSVMIEAGLKSSLENCVSERDRFLRENPRGDVYHHLAQHFGSSTSTQAVAEAGYTAYHHPPIPAHLPLAKGVREMLESLQNKYRLHLVTAGDPATQFAKVRALSIGPIFHHLWFVAPHHGQTKKEVFTQILRIERCAPSELLSIGNRLDQEIREAKELGCQTCYVEYGEYSQVSADHSAEIPDYKITQLTDLITTCQL